MKFHIVLTFIIGLGCASAHAEPLKFKSWKEQQIVEAQNEVLRLSAKLHAQKLGLKSDKTANEADFAGSGRFQQNSDINEKDLKNAQEALLIAKDFGLEDYADVYVSALQEEPDQFAKLMNSLSKDELSQLMKILVKNKNPAPARPTDDAKHKSKSSTPTLASTLSNT